MTAMYFSEDYRNELRAIYSDTKQLVADNALSRVQTKLKYLELRRPMLMLHCPLSL